MKDKLTQYIDLLFAGAPDADDIKQEILQNTLDRYDDLISQGKSPEAAYSLSIAGIGDIHEILGDGDHSHAVSPEIAPPAEKRSRRTLKIAIAVAFFILCPVPVIILQNSIGVCLLFVLVAAGVMLLIMNEGYRPDAVSAKPSRSPLHKALLGITWGVGICAYLLISFFTGAWYITWLVFPIIVCVCGLINACFDLNKRFLSAVVRIVIFTILTVVLVIALLGVCLGVTAFSYVAGEYEQIEGTVSSSGTVSAQTVKNIQIEWVSGSINVVPGDVEDILFSETGAVDEDGKMVWRQSGDRLHIQFTKPQWNFSLFGINNITSKDLTVTVPQEWLCNELDINSVSATISASSINVLEADIIIVSGTCTFTDCVIADFTVETVSGEVAYQGQSDSFDISTVSADCTAALSNCPAEVDMEGVSGDLTLFLPEESGFTLEMDTVSGDLSTDFATTSQSSRYICGDGACKISADTVSGDIRIKITQ